MTEPIKARIAEVIDNQTVAISAGATSGVKNGMRFKIFSEKKIDVLDPVSNEKLGELDIEKLRVQVTTLYDKFCLAETYEYETINVGGNYSGTSFATLNKLFEEPKLIKKRKTFDIDENEKRPINKTESIVRVGDRVEQLVEATRDG